MQNSAKKLEYEERFNAALLRLQACQEEKQVTSCLKCEKRFELQDPQQLCGCGL